jgi:hypothetical protein
MSTGSMPGKPPRKPLVRERRSDDGGAGLDQNGAVRVFNKGFTTVSGFEEEARTERWEKAIAEIRAAADR